MVGLSSRVIFGASILSTRGRKLSMKELIKLSGQSKLRKVERSLIHSRYIMSLLDTSKFLKSESWSCIVP